MLSNNQSQCAMLDESLGKAAQMMASKAYLHHFEKYGVGQEQMQESFLVCEEQLAHYTQLK